MKILHFSGLRLGAPFPEWPTRGAEIRAELRALLARLLGLAAADGYQAVISAGDLFDSNRVPTAELHAVRDLCNDHPGVTLAALPGAHDPWAAYSVYRYLSIDPPPNLLILAPHMGEPHRVGENLFLYGQGVDANDPQPAGLSALARIQEQGIHVAVYYGDLGRLRPGPEEGLFMATPEIVNHPFHYLALADGGPAEQLGAAQRPVCYAAPQGPFCDLAKGGGTAWAIELGGAVPHVTRLDLDGVHEREIVLDVTGFADIGSLAQAIRRRVEAKTLAHVVLTGTRPADRALLAPTLAHLCAGDVYALRLTDRTETRAPDPAADRDPALALLWDRFQAAPRDARQEWEDALKLYAAGITDPARWREAPWVRS